MIVYLGMSDNNYYFSNIELDDSKPVIVNPHGFKVDGNWQSVVSPSSCYNVVIYSGAFLRKVYESSLYESTEVIVRKISNSNIFDNISVSFIKEELNRDNTGVSLSEYFNVELTADDISRMRSSLDNSEAYDAMSDYAKTADPFVIATNLEDNFNG